MTGRPAGDFLAALGRKFRGALSPPVPADLIAPQDAYEVWPRALGRPPTPARLADLSGPRLARRRGEGERYFGCPSVSAQRLRAAVPRVLALLARH